MERSTMNSAKVFICGAGPGDPGLISVKGYRLLTKCDVVLYDRLVSKNLVDKIPSTIKKIYVGRESGKAVPTHQSRTNKLMLAYVLKGKSVLRLKGGDPLIFGRGAEEAEYLRRHNIQFEIIPGISSAIAAPAYAGIPLTHRGYSSSVALITGHEDETKQHLGVNLKAVASAVDTIVVLMGIERIEEIVQNLRAGGLKGTTKVAIVEKGTMKDQRVIVGNLNTILKKVARYKVTSPAVIVVGRVVSFSRRLAWLYPNG
ncbi:MAG: uroporphyrinogen-III C-methyltransferase [Nitrososphaeraceae archaeon]